MHVCGRVQDGVISVMTEEYSDEELEEILNKIEAWEKSFHESKYFKELTEEQKQESGFIISIFAEYMYSYIGLTPKKWNESGLIECCLDIIPEKVTADKSFFKSIAPVLSTFFDFLGEKKLLRKGSRLAKTVKEIDSQIVKNSSDSSRWGMAKSMLMDAKKAGVDLDNDNEVNKFIFFNNFKKIFKFWKW